MFPDSILAPLPTALLMGGFILSLGLIFLRFLLGPTQHDRLVCVESFTLVLAGFIAFMALLTGSNWFFDIALVVSLVGFLTTVAFGKFLEQGDIRDE